MAEEFIDLQKTLYPDLADKYEVLGSLHTSKLWHQLSVGLEGFIRDATNHRGNNVFELYTEFIYRFEGKLSQIRVALLASMVGRLYTQPEAAIAFLEKVLLARIRLGTEAALCLDMDIVILKLKSGAKQGAKDAKEALAIAKEKTLSLSIKDPIVFSRFFRATAEYRKCVGPAHEFYKSALMYLAYTPLEDLSPQEIFTLATDMALASVTGDDIFNFGEVIATPILSYLQGTPNEWMQQLVLALHRGDIDNFNLIVDGHHAQYYAQPALSAKHEDVKKKIVLLCLLNIAFEKPSFDRNISFAEIANRTRIPVDQVEWVCMRAMSQGLITGTIDEVDQIFTVTWVQPRVLDKEQLAQLSSQLEGWTEKVKCALVTIESQTPELYV